MRDGDEEADPTGRSTRTGTTVDEGCKADDDDRDHDGVRNEDENDMHTTPRDPRLGRRRRQGRRRGLRRRRRRERGRGRQPEGRLRRRLGRRRRGRRGRRTTSGAPCSPTTTRPACSSSRRATGHLTGAGHRRHPRHVERLRLRRGRRRARGGPWSSAPRSRQAFARRGRLRGRSGSSATRTSGRGEPGASEEPGDEEPGGGDERCRGSARASPAQADLGGDRDRRRGELRRERRLEPGRPGGRRARPPWPSPAARAPRSRPSVALDASARSSPSVTMRGRSACRASPRDVDRRRRGAEAASSTASRSRRGRGAPTASVGGTA